MYFTISVSNGWLGQLQGNVSVQRLLRSNPATPKFFPPETLAGWCILRPTIYKTTLKSALFCGLAVKENQYLQDEPKNQSLMRWNNFYQMAI